MNERDMGNGEYGSLTDEEFRVFSRFLGDPEDSAYCAPIPIYLGGRADVRVFRRYVAGYTYVTAGLVEDGGQIENSLGRYELMICTRRKSDWAAGFVSGLSPYTLTTSFEPGETISAEGVFPAASALKKVLLTTPRSLAQSFDIEGVRCGILLCVGITNREFDLCHSTGAEVLVAKLIERDVFPYTVPERASII